MKQFLISFFTLSIVSTGAVAQNGGVITGKVIDGGDEKIISAATINLLKAKDSSLVKVAVADRDGNFMFENVHEGKYLAYATSVGHGKTYTEPISVIDSTSKISLGVLKLLPITKQLEGVVVTAKKPFIERKIDKTVMNVDASITNVGTTALEMLEKAPGVTIDKDGNISLKGKQGVIILIDGRQTYMSGSDLASYLKNLPTGNLEQIEIMTNPSAKYDAAGNSGIINLKTKKLKQKGFNGSYNASYTQGFYPKFSTGLNLNYRRNKLNVFGSLSANKRKNFQDLTIERSFYNGNVFTGSFSQTALGYRTNENYNGKIGVDYIVSPKTTIGAVVTAYSVPSSMITRNTSYMKSISGSIDSSIVSYSNEVEKWKNIGTNLNFRHQFDSTGREITTDIDYLYYNPLKNQPINNATYDANGNFKGSQSLFGDHPSTIKIFSVKTDYTQMLNKKIKFESGLKVSAVETENKANFYTIVNGSKQVDYTRTNFFDYKENISAAYVNFSGQYKKWGWQAGLRGENTNYSGYMYGNPTQADSSFSNNYLSVFPTLYLTYAYNDKHQFGLNYGRRISRPDYESLNPFVMYIDPYTAGAGNPYLKPAYANVVELSHTYKQMLTTTFTYSYDKDLLSSSFEEKNRVIIQKEGNFSQRNSLNLSVSAQVPVKKWYNITIYTEGNYQHYTGFVNNAPIDLEMSRLLFQTQQMFSLKKDWSIEVSGFYGTKFNEGQLIINPIGQVDAGISKKVFKGKGTLKLGLRDIFKTGNASGYSSFGSTKVSFTQKRDNRVIGLSFNYRFGKPIKGAPKRKTGGASEEQGRVKSNG